MDKLFINGSFYDHRTGFSPPQAMLVREGKIVATGHPQDILPHAGPDVETVDASGYFIMPGFNDAHIHVWKVGNLKTHLLDLRGVASREALADMIRQAAHRAADGQSWIVARGFNEAGWNPSQLPTRDDLDRIDAHHPVYLLRTCAHVAVLNSMALSICAIDERTPIPMGGELRRDKKGRLTGVLTENALGLVSPFLPRYTAKQYEEMVEAAQDELLRYGITSVTDPAVHPELLEVYQNLEKAKRLSVRINAIPILQPDGATIPLELPSLQARPTLRVQTAKLFADGGLSSQTASLVRPYTTRVPGEEKNYGVLRLSLESIGDLVFSAQEKGFTLAIHAIGDRAIDQVLGVYERASRAFPRARANRIEHAELPSESHLDRMATLQSIAVVQPIFLEELGQNFRNSLDHGYLRDLLPIQSMLNRGIVTAFSTDAPVVSQVNPFVNMSAAISRTDGSGHVFNASEAVTMQQAIAAYTLGSAAAEFTDLEKGSLKVGQWADMIFLDQNPLESPPSVWKDLIVRRTYVGGDCVYTYKKIVVL